MLKISRFLARNWNLCNFGLFLPKFGWYGNTLNSLEKSGSTFELKPINLYWTYEKFLDFLQEMEMCNFGLFFLYLVAMATPLVPLEIEIPYLKSPTQKPDFSCEKVLDFLHRTEISALLAYFFSNLVALATPLAPLKILIAYWNSPASKSPMYMQKISQFLAENWWVQFFCPNLVAWRPPWLPWNFIYHNWIRRPRKPSNYVINSSISCTEQKSVQFWLIFA